MEKMKFKVGDLIMRVSDQNINGSPLILKVTKIYKPPYRGKDQFGYKADYIKFSRSSGVYFWENWGHSTAMGLERRYIKYGSIKS